MSSKGLNADFQSITPCQKRIIHLIAEGYKDEEIAKELYVSLETVTNDQVSAMRKFNVRNVSCMIEYALRNGVINQGGRL
jgi:two-component system response regulator NreC